MRLRRAVAIAACLAAAVAAAVAFSSRRPPAPDAAEGPRDAGPVPEAAPLAAVEDEGPTDVRPGLRAPPAEPGSRTRFVIRPPAAGHRPGTILFVEVARDDGSGRVTAIVSVAGAGERRPPRPTDWPGVTAETEADASAEGAIAVVLKGLPRGRYSVLVRSQGEHGERDFASPRDVAVGGESDGATFDVGGTESRATALVIARRAGQGLHQSWLSVKAGPFSVYASPIGSVEFAMPVPADTDLVFALSWFPGKEEVGDVAPIHARIPAGTSAPVVFEVPAGVPVRVAARTPDGGRVRVERLHLWAFDAPEAAPRWLNPEAVFGWGDNGLRREGRLAPGRYRVGVVPQGDFAYASAALDVATEGETSLDVPVAAVTDGVLLRLRRSGASSWPKSYLSLTTAGVDADVADARQVNREFAGLGVVRLPPLPPGPYDLWIAPEGCVAGTLRVEVPPGPGAVVDAVWEEPAGGPGQVRCRVETPDGRVVRACDVYLERDGEACRRRGNTGTGIFQGTADLRSLPVGRWRLRVPPSWFHAPAGHAEHVQDLDLVPGRREYAVKVVLRAP